MNKSKWVTTDFESLKTLPSFNKEFLLKKDIKKVKLNITCIGLYYPYINNKVVTNNLFMPGWTDYLKRVQYQSYDITNLINKGHNEIKVLIGRGWASADSFGWSKHPYIDRPLLKAKIEITYKDGTKDYIRTDSSWDVYSSHIVSSDIYNGEIQDLNLSSNYIGKVIESTSDIKVIKQEGEDIIKKEIIYPRKMFKDNLNNTLIDFGQNFAGNIEIRINGKKGDKISFIPAEILDKSGNFYNENYREAKSLYEYTLKDGENILFPLFSFEGLRYIKLIEYPDYFSINNIRAHAIHSNMKRTCYIDTGNEKINQLYHNTIYGQLSNYLDVPTDCPQRDERLGWLGDAQVFVKTASINFNTLKFFKKWLHDLALDQHKDGSIEGVCPTIPGHEVEISSGWADACTICPYEIYMTYGDKSILKDSFNMMKKWVDYIKNTGDNPYLFDSGFHFGDWVGTDSPYGSFFGATNLFIVASAFYANSVDILIKTGHILDIDVSNYEDLYKKIVKEFQKTFLKDGLPIGERAIEHSQPEKSTNFTQAEIALILHFSLCEDKDREKLTNALVELIKDNGMRMTTGFLGTPYLLHALTDNGRSDIAYNLLLQEKKPSWLYSINNGATTIWEHYDGISEDGKLWSPIMNSFNHYSYGAVIDWIYGGAGGIKVIKEDYKEIEINPHVDTRLGHLDIKYMTSRGLLHVRWYFQDNATIYEIEIPKDTIAHIKIDNKEYIVNEGSYMFSKEGLD